jgi:hypothetical protein
VPFKPPLGRRGVGADLLALFLVWNPEIRKIRMRFQSGKFAGKTTEEVLLKFPDWAAWNVRQYPDSKHSKVFKELWRTFDAKPFTAPCRSCGEKATRASAYRGSPELMFWCDDCDPRSTGIESGKLRIVWTLGEVLEHVEITADGNRDWSRRIVRALAEAKGLPKRVGEKAALAFFGP